MSNLYSERANEKRKQFNNLINRCNMVLMNNIPDVDDSIWDNWEGDSPSETCDIVPMSEADEANRGDDNDFYCNTHKLATDEEWECEEYTDNDVYQWFAIGEDDAQFLKRHKQYITYSDKLDTYFLAITHFGTSWDYTSMVDDFEDMYHGLDELNDEKEVA